MTYTILHIATSPLGANSVTRKLADKTLAAVLAKHPGANVITRDLAAKPLPHLDGVTLGAYFTPPENRSAEQQVAIAASDEAVDELLVADTIIIDAPMWNFGIPSALKAWVDHVARAGRTFKYTATGPVPLTPAGKKAIIVSSRGGIYSQGPAQPMDHQEPYLKTFLGFLGITDVAFVRAEGVAMGPDAVTKAMGAVDAQIAATIAAA